MRCLMDIDRDARLVAENLAWAVTTGDARYRDTLLDQYENLKSEGKAKGLEIQDWRDLADY